MRQDEVLASTRAPAKARAMPFLSVGRRFKRRETTEAIKKKQRLVIVGGGMTALRLCERLVKLNGTERYTVRVLGEEPSLAYDRINLARVVKGEPVETLALQKPSWCSANSIDWHSGEQVLEIDRAARSVRTGKETYQYDKLVMATGSRPVVPKLKGIDDPRITPYRTVGDAHRIRELAAAHEGSNQPAVVLGGGLLGIEAADMLTALGCEVRVIEAAGHMLPRQLDEEAASHLHRAMLERGLSLSFGARIQQIWPEAQSLRLQTTANEFLDASFVVLAIGVHPRDEIARTSGLACDLFGGIKVTDDLVTSDPQIFAVGECARHRGHSYGLVAPGYDMADCLAQRLLGRESKFTGFALATRLKVDGIDLSVIGEATLKDLATKNYVHAKNGTFRKLVTHRGKLVGATAIGEWEELASAQQAISQKERITRKQCRAFEQGNAAWAGVNVDVRSWPENVTVCQCTGVTCGTLKSARRDGATTSTALMKETGAGSICGTCLPLLENLVGEPTTATVSTPRTFIWSIALLTLVAIPVLYVLAPVPFSQTVQQQIPLDTLWRNSIAKQVSGFSLLALCGAAAALGLRKRWTRLHKLGAYAKWQSVHAALGLACILGFFVHTGLRLGNNIDAVLGGVFIVTLLAGAVAGIALSQRSKRPTQRRTSVSKKANSWHLWIQWPLPLLVTAHVVKVYFF